MVIYSEDMYIDFYRKCIEVEAELRANLDVCAKCRRGYLISPEAIYSKAILKPAESFYYADEYQLLKAFRCFRYGKRLTSQNKGSARSLRYKEISRLYDKIKAENPQLKAIQIAKLVHETKPSRFYIGVSQAKHIYYSMYESNGKIYKRKTC